MKKFFMAAGIWLFTCSMVKAQQADSILSAWAASVPVEKLYIQYDKEYYVAGETIWFKGYLYKDGKPSSQSHNFYLQFTDAKGAMVATKKYPVMGAVVKGSIRVPDSLPQGNYYIRAFTPVMLNSAEDFIYHKNIYIYNPATNPVPATKEVSNISLQFFPESGQLVHGILTTVAFKAADQWGTPFEAHGIIKTEDGTTVAPFHSYHDGIGKLQFKPIAGKKYFAELETPAGMRTYPLPEIQTKGVNIKIQDEKGGKKFQLAKTENTSGEFAVVRLVVQINNSVVYNNEIAFEDYPSVIGHLVTDSLPSGILHFTVFNKDGVPLAERLSFVNNNEYRVNGQLNAVTVSFEKKAANKLEITFDKAIQRSCSVAVIEMPSRSFEDNDNIWSRFLLTADLKGKIFNPAWYFENDNDSTTLALDNLMLTHGWSRFNWTKLLRKEFPVERYTDDKLLILSGKVVDQKTKQPLTTGQLNILMEAEDSSTQVFELPLGKDGTFRKDSVLFFGNARLFYSYLDKNGKPRPGLVIMDNNGDAFAERDLVPAGAFAHTGAKNLSSLANKEEIAKRTGFVVTHLEEMKELERVTVQAKSNARPVDKVNEQYAKGVFKSEANVTLDNINDPANDRSMNAVSYIQNRIRTLETEGGSFVNRKNFSLLGGRKWTVGIFLDGSPISLNNLRNLRADDIALVKFWEAGFVGVGSEYPGGAVAVYTKERSNKNQKDDKLEFVEYNGYSVTKEFFSPDYSLADLKHPVADNRTTLYWNPDLYTDRDSKSIQVEFYNNDFTKKFKIVVEGFDAAGKLLHIEKTIGQ